MKPTIPPRPIEERFWNKVEKTDACWLWLGAKNSQGYGLIGRGGRGAGNVRAHRLSFEIAVGPIPEGMDVCHRCDNPPCVRPDHLFLGTRSENMADAKSKGRTVPPPLHVGEGCHLAKLTKDDIYVVRQLASSGVAHRRIASQFGVSRSSIGKIASRRVWRHVA